MKKLFYIIIMIMTLLIMGCSVNPNPAPGANLQVSGYVFDQNHSGVKGVKLSLGSLNTTSDATGRYSFSGVIPGDYLLSGSGGDGAHYVAVPANIKMVNNAIEKDILAYKIIGCGVIMQNAGGVQSSSLRMFSPDWKELFLNDISSSCSNLSNQTSRIVAKSVFQKPLLDYIAFVLVSWEPVNGVSRYKINFLGTDGALDVTIWDSLDTHTGDPGFDLNVPQAYLDLSDELHNKINTSGTYRFRIDCFNNTGNLVKQLPEITVSLGMLLGDLPGGLNISGNQFVWTGVAGAGGYKVGIYTDKDLKHHAPVWNNGVTILDAGSSSVIIPELDPGTYYWHVDARAYDETGWPAEITRGISSLIK